MLVGVRERRRRQAEDAEQAQQECEQEALHGVTLTARRAGENAFRDRIAITGARAAIRAEPRAPAIARRHGGARQHAHVGELPSAPSKFAARRVERARRIIVDAAPAARLRGRACASPRAASSASHAVARVRAAARARVPAQQRAARTSNARLGRSMSSSARASCCSPRAASASASAARIESSSRRERQRRAVVGDGAIEIAVRARAVRRAPRAGRRAHADPRASRRRIACRAARAPARIWPLPASASARQAKPIRAIAAAACGELRAIARAPAKSPRTRRTEARCSARVAVVRRFARASHRAALRRPANRGETAASCAYSGAARRSQRRPRSTAARARPRRGRRYIGSRRRVRALDEGRGERDAGRRRGADAAPARRSAPRSSSSGTDLPNVGDHEVRIGGHEAIGRRRDRPLGARRGGDRQQRQQTCWTPHHSSPVPINGSNIAGSSASC